MVMECERDASRSLSITMYHSQLFSLRQAWSFIKFWQCQRGMVFGCHSGSFGVVGVPPPEALHGIFFVVRPVEADVTEVGIADNMYTSLPLAEPLFAVEDSLGQRIFASFQPVL